MPLRDHGLYFEFRLHIYTCVCSLIKFTFMPASQHLSQFSDFIVPYSGPKLKNQNLPIDVNIRNRKFRYDFTLRLKSRAAFYKISSARAFLHCGSSRENQVSSFLEMILWFWTVVCHSIVLSTQITSNHLHQSYNDTQPTLFCDSISQSVSDHEFNLSCTDCPELQLQRKNVRSTKSHYVQHWLRKWFGSVRQHAIFLSNDNSDLCCHMTQ